MKNIRHRDARPLCTIMNWVLNDNDDPKNGQNPLNLYQCAIYTEDYYRVVY